MMVPTWPNDWVHVVTRDFTVVSGFTWKCLSDPIITPVTRILFMTIYMYIEVFLEIIEHIKEPKN